MWKEGRPPRSGRSQPGGGFARKVGEKVLNGSGSAAFRQHFLHGAQQQGRELLEQLARLCCRVIAVLVHRDAAGFRIGARGDAAGEVFATAFGEEYGKPISESSTKDSAEAMQQTTDAITANPDINVVVCENEDQYNGAREAILALGKEKEIICTAVDCSVVMCEHILDPEDLILQGCGAQNSYYMGYQGCKNLCETILGTRTDYEPGVVEYLEVPKLNKANLDAVQEFLDMLKSFE